MTLFKDDGAGIYITQDGEKIYISIEEKNKLERGCAYLDGEIIETDTYLSYLKDLEKSEALKIFNASLDEINSKYSDYERETFEIKRVLAEDYINNGNESAFLTALCKDGETVNELANTIITNSSAYQSLYANAEKVYRETIESIEAEYSSNATEEATGTEEEAVEEMIDSLIEEN